MVLYGTDEIPNLHRVRTGFGTAGVYDVLTGATRPAGAGGSRPDASPGSRSGRTDTALGWSRGGLTVHRIDHSTALRERLMQCLTRAYQALADDTVSYQDALAVARNMAMTVISDVDTMGASPALADTLLPAHASP